MVRKKYIILPALFFASFASCMEGVGFITVMGLGGGIAHLAHNSIREAERAADRAVANAAEVARGVAAETIQNADATLERRVKETRREGAGFAANVAGAAGDGANASRDSILRSEGLLPPEPVSLNPTVDLSGVPFKQIKGKIPLLISMADIVDRKTTDNTTPPPDIRLHVRVLRNYVVEGLSLLESRFKDRGGFLRWLGSITSWQQAFLVLGMSEAWGYDVDSFGIIKRIEGDNHRPFLEDLKDLVVRSLRSISPFRLEAKQVSGLRRAVMYLNANGYTVDRALLKVVLNKDYIRFPFDKNITEEDFFNLDALPADVKALATKALSDMKDFTDSVIKREAGMANAIFAELGLFCPVGLPPMKPNARRPALVDYIRIGATAICGSHS